MRLGRKRWIGGEKGFKPAPISQPAMAVYTDGNPPGKYFRATVIDVAREHNALFARLPEENPPGGCRIPQHEESPAYQSRWNEIRDDIRKRKSVSVTVRCVGIEQGKVCDLVQRVNGVLGPYDGVNTRIWLPHISKIRVDEELRVGDTVKEVYLHRDGNRPDLVVLSPYSKVIFARDSSSLEAGLYDIEIASELPERRTMFARIVRSRQQG